MDYTDADVLEDINETLTINMEIQDIDFGRDIAVSTEFSVSFIDDDEFLAEANARLLAEQDDELQLRVDYMIQGADDGLPLNQNVRQTLDVLHHRYGLVVSTCSSSLSALVASVMSRTSLSAFRIQTPGGPVTLPPSRLLLRRISQAAQIKIVVVSTRCKKLVFEPVGEPKALVVLAHIADSFQGVNTYTALTCSVTSPNRDFRMPSVRLPPVIPTAERATYREAKRSTTREIIEFSVLEAEESFLSGCKTTLKKRINVAVNKVVSKTKGKKKGPVDIRAALEKEYVDFIDAECKLQRLPRGLMQDAISTLETSLGVGKGRISNNDFTLRMSMEQTHTAYRNFMKENGCLFWDHSVENKDKKLELEPVSSQSHVQEIPSQVNDISKTQEIRMCDAPLHRILRKDFCKDNITRIQGILEEKQTSMSDHMDEIQVAVLKVHMEVFRGLLHETAEEVDISDILPTDFEIRDARIKNDRILKVAKGTTVFIEETIKTDSDLHNLFNQSCLEHLAAKLSPTSSSSEPPLKKPRLAGDGDAESQGGSGYGKHPKWDKLAHCIQQTMYATDNIKCPHGMSRTRNEMLRAMATNIHNIWNGSIYNDLKRAVVRCLVRVFLRPLSEEWYRQFKKKKAKERRERIAAKQGKARKRQKRSWQRTTSLINQLDSTIGTCDRRWSGATLFLSDPQTGGCPRVTRVQTLIGLLNPAVAPLLSPFAAVDDEYEDEAYMDIDEDDDDDADIWEADDADGFEEAVEAEMSIATLGQAIESTEKAAARKKEPKSKYLKGIEALICKLIDMASLPDLISEAEIRNHLFSGQSFKDNEIQVAVHIVNALRPFAPKKDASGSIPHHVLATGPFAYLANHLLIAMGFSEFSRQLSPVSSAGKLLPLPLNSTGISESLCALDPHHFDIFDSTGLLVSDQKHAPGNAPTIFSAFFDMQVIHATCAKFGLRFGDRLVFVDEHTVRIMGYEARPNAPRNMIKEKRKKLGKGRSREPTDAEQRQIVLHESKLSKAEAKISAADHDVRITELKEEIKALNRQLGLEEIRMKSVNADLRRLKTEKRKENDVNRKECLGEEIDTAFRDLHTLRSSVHRLRRKALPMRNQIKGLRQKKYDLDKYVSSESKPKTEKESNGELSESVTSKFSSTPSLLRRGCLDSVESTSIDSLVKDIETNNADQRNRRIVLVPGGTDPGAHVLFNTVPITENKLIELRNRFEILSNEGAESEQDPEEGVQSIDQIRFPDPHQVTVKHIRHHAGLVKQSRFRKKLIAANAEVRKAHADLADNSIRRANSSHAIEQAQETRRNCRTTLRSFEKSRRMKNLRRRTELQLRNTYDKVAAAERDAFKRVVNVDSNSLQTSGEPSYPSTGYCTDCRTHHRPEFVVDPSAPRGRRLVLKHVNQCPRASPIVMPLMLHGAAGSGVGSRLKGHSKMGGNKIPEKHLRYTPVLKTNEHKSSQLCPFCFSQIRLVRARRNKNGVMRLVRVHGAIQCTNPDCPSFKVGYADRGRDTNAAVNIALAGYVCLTSSDHKTLPPFNPRCPAWEPSSNTRSISTGTSTFPLAPQVDAKILELGIRSTYSQ
ncbi:hypothetical protein EMPS_06637 [Entomortierella parvispora]|uniref:Uncharacterized protein n=1 Tax=Entomortierella parvispora TaxID=205924 RepID=A0A9P3HCR5_9FUNG|nr:hypothetical protein EMPS_06637 [Entomortierella parvispora]